MELLLHGILDITIYDAKKLPNMDKFSMNLSKVMKKSVPTKILEKIDRHVPTQHNITSDPYVKVNLDHTAVARTRVIDNDENPVWNQHSRVLVAHYVANVRFEVKDSDFIDTQLIGTVSIPARQFYNGDRVEGSFQILGSECEAGTVLRIAIQFTPIQRLTSYNLGIDGFHEKGIPGTYFPLRKGGKVTLYQDAHVPDECLRAVKLDSELHFQQGKCWQEIYEAIKQAKKLIYITGWSVYHLVRLVRDPDLESETLGDLLKAKSQEGVRVLLLVWDDPSSHSVLKFNFGPSYMQTHDEETRRFFKYSSVHAILCARTAGKRHGFAKKQKDILAYSHHQKSVVLDTDAGNGKRKIIAFLGGLDLCDGRYDTPNHHLFKTLKTVHKEDYYNKALPMTATSPREPWHDLHCKIDGPAAYDVLENFEKRWVKASKPHGIEKLSRSKRHQDDALLKLQNISEIYRMDDAPCLDESDPEAWHVQIFRSIDSNSVKGFPKAKDTSEVLRKNLAYGKNVRIDSSIHTAYVEAIRSAQRFLYIENQYFIGSSYNWSSEKDAGAHNLIPMEIALKIAGKIKANERFSAYVVIPLFPEGATTASATRAMLHWQWRTMEMMYETVNKALAEVGLEDTYHPGDYLNFFCLGNREAQDKAVVRSPDSCAEDTPEALAQRNRRFMIYVHSKGIIVDDEYVILGSANINQRSMDGSRDTEIAMGAYQPHHTCARKSSNPLGQIYGYRMSLWSEHLGMLEECFGHPESLECVRRVNQLAESNWKQFTADEVTDMTGHLMKYPVDVDPRGKVRALANCPTFPDCGGEILASNEDVLIPERFTV